MLGNISYHKKTVVDMRLTVRIIQLTINEANSAPANFGFSNIEASVEC